jgi:hypothetical protein
MTYNSKLTALHKGLTPIHPDQDRINFAPKLAEDIRILLSTGEYLTFNKVRDDGTVWAVSDIEGWWTLAEPSIPNIERGFGDGSFDIDGRLMARDLTLTGSVLITASDRPTIAATSAAVRQELLEAFNLVKSGTWLIVDEDEFKRAAFVRLSGRPEISTVNSRGRIDFQIGLRAADPIKYQWVENLDVSELPEGEQVIGNGFNLARITTASASQEFRELSESSDFNEYFRFDPSDFRLNDTPSDDGNYVISYQNVTFSESGSSSGASVNTATIINHGNSDVYCIFRVLGPLRGPAVIANYTTGQYINFVDPASASDVLISADNFMQIDTKDRKVNLGDNINGLSSDSFRSSLQPLVDWIYLQPGDNIIYFNDFGTGTVTDAPVLQVYWRSGWIG